MIDERLTIEKNDVITLEIESFGAFGEGVSHVLGMAIFVPYACPGEIVEAHVLSVKKGYAYAKLLKVITQSKIRSEAKCPHFYKCGGCDLQHIAYDSQLKMKTDSVKETLRRVGGVEVESIDIVNGKPYDCRNKLTLPFSISNGKVILGFYSERSHRVVEIRECPLSAWSSKVISIVCDWANDEKLTVYDEKTGRGILRALSVRVVEGRFMFTLITTTDKFKGIDGLLDKLTKEYPNCILYLNINSKSTNVVLGDKNILISGEERLRGEAVGVKYSLSPMSFSQVNDEMRDALYTEVLSNIDEGAIVVDAYSGAGVMSVLVSKKASKVYGIEIVGEAVIDADITAKDNGVSDKIKNIAGDCAVELPKLLKTIRKTHVGLINLILDPPRKGCDDSVIDAVLKSLPDKIIYVSCNPATLSRDIKKLSEKYNVEKVKLFDMFPNTKHVESVVCLKRRLDNELPLA